MLSEARRAAASVKRAVGFRPRIGGPLTVGVGDSITAGHTYPRLNLAANDSYFDVLAHRRALGRTRNLGMPGHTARQIADRLDEVLTLAPDRALILAGTNDVHLDMPGGTIDALEEMRARFEAAGVSVRFGLLPPQDRRPAEVIAMNADIREWASGAGVQVFDFHTPTADDSGRWKPGYSHDGLHPTAAGTRALADAVPAANIRQSPVSPP